MKIYKENKIIVKKKKKTMKNLNKKKFYRHLLIFNDNFIYNRNNTKNLKLL